ncbi:MAG TPA: spore germination protein [Clostridiales bacterium]|nr:MAG: spore gernimation protein KA [Clostridiales bacterium GWD2_32_59]HAN09740.1 spore germination protein [Clostridiales bacterium]
MFFDKKKEEKNESKEDDLKKEESKNLSTKISIERIKSKLGRSVDFACKKFNVNSNKDLPVSIIYINGLIDSLKTSEFILQPLAESETLKSAETPQEVIKLIEQGALYYSSQTKRDKEDDIIKDVIEGSVALIFEQESIAFTFDLKGFERRSIGEPSSENVKKGGKDSFVETLRVNTATIRRRIKTPDLIIEEKVVGRQSKTQLNIVYIDGITNMDIVNSVKKKIDEMDIDQVLSIGKLDEFINEKKYSVFPQVDYTERPDKFCSDIIEGRVGIIVDGLPMGVIVPTEFAKLLQAPEDYSEDSIIASLVRLLRYFLLISTILLPGFYIAVTTFHPEMIPSELAMSIAESKEGVPLPIFFEVILMLVAFEILVEAGLRMPKTISQAVSIVGALVVGDAAVTAKLISPGVVIVIAIAAIASYAVPNQDLSNAIRLWRFIFVILSSIIGLFGLMIGVILILFNLAKMETFGVAYLEPFVESETMQAGDSLIRLPIKFLKYRPNFLKTYNKKRIG